MVRSEEQGEHKNEDISGTISWIDLKLAQHLHEGVCYAVEHNGVKITMTSQHGTDGDMVSTSGKYSHIHAHIITQNWHII